MNYDYYDENMDYHDEEDGEEGDDRYHDVDNSEEGTELYGVTLKRQSNHNIYQEEEEEGPYEYEDAFGNTVVINLHDNENKHDDTNTGENSNTQEKFKNKRTT